MGDSFMLSKPKGKAQGCIVFGKRVFEALIL